MMHKSHNRPISATKTGGYGKDVPYLSEKEIKKYKCEALILKIEKIKEACTRLKNSPVSKTDALKEIKNICLSKDDEEKVWKEVLGDNL